MEIDVQAAQTQFLQLLIQVEAGGEVIFFEEGRPIARLVPYEHKPAGRTPGLDRGTIRIAEDFDAPLPPEFQKFFEE